MVKETFLEDFILTMNECGFDVAEESLDDELQYDSLQFVSTMVSIEEKYGITIPDDYMLGEGLDTARDFINMVYLLKETEDEKQ
ncbi:MAG: acyl carrier protein [Clostridia bacterium]|nr:acyl carrier protein [Clostridia bacterium]